MLNIAQGNMLPLDITNPIKSVLEGALPFNSHDMWDIEHEIQRLTSLIGDQIMLDKLEQVHNEEEFVKEAVKRAREESDYPLVNKGLKPVSILLLGGTRVVIKTSYLRKDWKKISGRKHKKRGKKGSGIYPVLEVLGISDRVSPATRSEIALYTVQAASYQEGILMLERRGIKCSPTILAGIANSTAQADISLRDAALAAAMNIPVAPDGPLAGKRVRVSVDGGKTRIRKNKKGRKTKKNRHRFKSPWREPRILVIDLLDEEGGYAVKLPLYDVLINDANATFSLLVGYLRMLGAAYAEVIEFVADGADWIWDRIDEMSIQAEIPESKLVQVLDFYHGSEHLSEAVELLGNVPKKERQKLYKELRHILRHDKDGISKVIKRLKQLGEEHKVEEMEKALVYFEKHLDRMQYASFDAMKLPVGSGQVESAVRRVINLRFKGPGIFWKEQRVEVLMHLRACFKSGRWDELINRLLSGIFLIPSFELL